LIAPLSSGNILALERLRSSLPSIPGRKGLFNVGLISTVMMEFGVMVCFAFASKIFNEKLIYWPILRLICTATTDCPYLHQGMRRATTWDCVNLAHNGCALMDYFAPMTCAMS
jgi:hypothetical protein